MKWALTALCLASAAPAAAQYDLSKVQIRTEQIRPGFHVLFGAGGNIGVWSGADGVLLIDAQFGPLAPKIQAAVKAISHSPIRYLVNTHWHFDHVGGNENLGKAGALIVGHDNARSRMSTKQHMPLFGQSFDPMPFAALPVMTLSENASFNLNGATIRAIHMPNAHTDGDVVIHLPAANIVQMGDIFYNGVYPYIDVDTGGSVQGLLSAIDRTLALVNDDTVIVPGHGPLGQRADLVAYRDMIRDVTDRVAARIRVGDSLEQILRSKPTAPHDAKWGQGFVKGDLLIRFIHISLTRGQQQPPAVSKGNRP